MKYLGLVLQHREGIYWCPAPLRDEDQHNYKVRGVADMQAAPAPPIDKYISYSTVGSDNEALVALHRAHPRSSRHDARGRLRGR
jgi:hypothetical protein